MAIQLDGETIESGETVEVSGLKGLIPDGTELEVEVIGGAIETNGYGSKLVIDLLVISQGEYQGREEKHNLKAFDESLAKQKKALEMLAFYDRAGKGAIASNPKNWDELDATEYYDALAGTRVIAKFAVWEMDGDDGTKRTGNWIQALKPVPRQRPAARPAPAQARAQAARPAPAPATSYDDFSDDDIPFD